MRSERDLAIIELAHLETRYDAVIKERNDLLARKRRTEEEEEEGLLRGAASGESSGLRGLGWGEARATMMSEEDRAARAGEEEDTEPGSAEAEAAVAGGCRGGSSDAIPAAEAESGDAMLVVARLRAEIESSHRRLSEAAARIASLSEEKVDLVTRIACALGHHDVAETLRAKDDALDEARSTIAALRAGIGDFDDSSSSSSEAAEFFSTAGNNNNARKVSLEGAGSLLPVIATTSGEKKVPSFTTDGTSTNEVSMSPRSRREPNSIRPKSAMIKPRDSSSSSSIGSGRSSIGSGRVSFDRGTSFDRCAKLPKFDLFTSPAHGKENFGRRRKRQVAKSSFGGGADADANADADGGSSPSTQTAEGSSCEGGVGGRRRKKHYSGGSCGGNGKSKSFSSGAFYNDGGFL